MVIKPQQEVPISEFQAQCLELTQKVHDRTIEELVVTKQGKPFVRLSSVEAAPAKDLFGLMGDTLEVDGDLTAPTGEDWAALSE